MKQDIVLFIRKLIKHYGFEAYYMPVDDVYMLTKDGKCIQNFNAHQFYQQPRNYRFRELGAIMRIGLSHNMGEKGLYNQVEQLKFIGKKIT